LREREMILAPAGFFRFCLLSKGTRERETARTQSGKAFEMLKSARAGTGRAEGLGKMSVRLTRLHVMLARWAEDLRKIMARGCGLRAAVRR
jgi:hypothetical protein